MHFKELQNYSQVSYSKFIRPCALARSVLSWTPYIIGKQVNVGFLS